MYMGGTGITTPIDDEETGKLLFFVFFSLMITLHVFLFFDDDGRSISTTKFLMF